MNANNTSLTLSSRLIRIVFLVFLLQQFSSPNNTVDAAYFDFANKHTIDSCKDFGVFAGDSLQEDCTGFCAPNTMEVFDYANIDEDPNSVVRNTVCRCFEYGEAPDAPKTKSFECWSKAEVWDKTKPVMKCEDVYGIESLSTCKKFCKTLDPMAFAYRGFSGSSECDCGGVPVCSDAAPAASSDGTTTRATAVSSVLALVVGFVVALRS
jgi:hypothetical protein